MSFIAINSLTKKFDSLVAVDDVSFDIEQGEFISILGPSGSGKSTILRMIAGFETPTEGAITIDDESVVGRPPFNRDVNMMFQDLALFPHLTVHENIAYGLKQRGVGAEERQDRVQEMLEIVELEDYGDREPHELSGGEQQRVALARALVNKPKLLLFDEPLASLDRKLRQHMQIELQRIQHETGVTFLYVTHDQEVAMSVSDRLVLLNGGSIEQVGTAEELYERPNNQFVANFIGDINTLSGRLESTNETVTVDIDGQSFQLPDIHLGPKIDGDDVGSIVQFCVRPDDIRLSNSSGDGPGLTGSIRNRIYKGGTVTYHVNTDVGTITADVDTGRFSVGDDVHVSWKEGDGFLFLQGEGK